ncbi:hypothetical protein [Winogradskyella sp. SYSU M77433]|uniref:hypothetical protein n=1 Tax=Winogradskyella sp. SYSU M77433 TaxID=3042722 RepID=UPI00248074D2|nr:hypothetical protein [Winogradskyella sp. SYSU M77433]MDH7912085.1 hypothetical protein [Winogradskyella sp. SYSU M77433]
MVKIMDYKTYQREDGTEFHSLVVQGGIEAVKSKETDRVYLTIRKARVSCTFDEETCKELIGTTMPGKIEKVMVDPYEYAIPDTGELITLSHRYEYLSEDDVTVKENMVEQELVI